MQVGYICTRTANSGGALIYCNIIIIIDFFLNSKYSQVFDSFFSSKFTKWGGERWEEGT